MLDNEGAAHSGEPNKKEILVTRNTKKELVTVIERCALESTRVYPPELDEITGGMRYIRLNGTEDNVSVDIDILNLPKGNPDKPNLRWTVITERTDEPSLLKEYMLFEIPDGWDDGWDIEYHERVHTPEDQAAIDDALDKEGLNNGVPEAIQTRYDEREASIRTTKELDMAGVYEGQAQRLITLLTASTKQDS